MANQPGDTQIRIAANDDQAVAALRSLEQAVKAGARALDQLKQASAGLGTLQQRGQESARAVAQIGGQVQIVSPMIARLGTDASRATEALNRLGRQGSQELKQLGEAAKQANQSTRGLGAGGDDGNLTLLGRLGRAAGFLAIGQTLLGIGREAGRTAASIEEVDTRLRGLTRSGEEFANTQKFLSDLAQQQHKDYLVLADTYANLLALQKDGVITQDQSRALLAGLGNAAAQLGASNQQLQLSFNGLQQALGKSNLEWEELKQVTEPLPGLLFKVVAASGRSLSVLQDHLKQHQISGQEFVAILLKALDQYDGAAARTAGNINAHLTDVRNAWIALVEEFQKPINLAATSALSLVTKLLKGGATGIRDLRGARQEMFSTDDIEKKLNGFSLTEQTQAYEQYLQQRIKKEFTAPPSAAPPPAPSKAQELITELEKERAAVLAGEEAYRDYQAAKAAVAGLDKLGKVTEAERRQIIELNQAIEKAKALRQAAARQTKEDEQVNQQALEADITKSRQRLEQETAVMEAEKQKELEIAGENARAKLDIEQRYQTASLSLKREALRQEVNLREQQAALSTDPSNRTQLIAQAAALREQIAASQALEQAQNDLTEARRRQLDLQAQDNAARTGLDTYRATVESSGQILSKQRELDLLLAGQDAEKRLRIEQDYVDRVLALKLDLYRREAQARRDQASRATDPDGQARLLGEAARFDAEAQGLTVIAQYDKQILELNGRADTLKTTVDQLGLTFASAFEDAIVNGRAFSDVLKGLLQDITRLALRETVTKPLFNALGGVLSAGLGGLFGAGGFSGLSPTDASLGGGIAGVTFPGASLHSGGIAGAGGLSVRIPALALAAAPRLHQGGLAGLAPDEVPAILQRGEEVLTRRDPRHRANGGGGNTQVTVNVAVDHSGARDNADPRTKGGDLGRAISRAVQEEIARQKRPGGLLYA